MDGADFLRRRRDAGAAQVEHQDLVAGAVHPRDAAADQRAGGSRNSRGLLSLAVTIQGFAHARIALL
jgi:hypothetical protein